MPELHDVLPKYLQVANYYRDLIATGVLSAGSEIPSERQLASDWGISRPTATRPLGALPTQGLVESRQRLGTYVREQVQLPGGARDRFHAATARSLDPELGEHHDRAGLRRRRTGDAASRAQVRGQH